MDRERFDLVHVSTADERLVTERLAQIDYQIPDLLARHRIVHDAILGVYYAIVLLVASMFVVAAAALTDQAWLAMLVIVFLLAGTAVLLYAMVLTTSEIRRSRHSIVYEAQGALRLIRTPADPPHDPSE